jgi:hypothetical protein
MKQYKLILIGLLLSFSFMACKKTTTDQVMSSDQLQIGSYLWLDSVINNNKSFGLTTFTTASIGIMVHVVGEPAAKINSYVSSSVDATGSPTNSLNKSTWKLVKVTTPVDNKATITVTGQDILTALGRTTASVKAGQQYVIYNEIETTSGKIYNINNMNAEFESAPDYHVAFRFSGTVVCPGFDITPFQGNFVVVTDKWNDTSPGDIILLTPIDATHFSFNYNPTNHAGTLINSKPIVVTVDPTINPATQLPTPSVAFQIPGTAWTYDPGPSVNTRPQDANVINWCSGTITLFLMWGEAGTVYGPYQFTLRKQ